MKKKESDKMTKFQKVIIGLLFLAALSVGIYMYKERASCRSFLRWAEGSELQLNLVFKRTHLRSRFDYCFKKIYGVNFDYAKSDGTKEFDYKPSP